MALDADAVVGVSGEDVAELRDLLDRIRLQDRAVATEQQRRLEIHQDSVFGASRVGDLPKLLLLLVEVVADGAPSDASDDRTDGRAFPSAGQAADAGAYQRSAASADRRALTGRGARPKDHSDERQRDKLPHRNLHGVLSAVSRIQDPCRLWRASRPGVVILFTAVDRGILGPSGARDGRAGG